MPITIDKIKEAQEKLEEVKRRAVSVGEVLFKVSKAVLVDAKEEIIVDLTADQKTALLAEYNVRKTALQTAVNELL